jgi:hypothetical protein
VVLTTAALTLPEQCRKRLRTANGSERLNEEVRRRERVIRIFPNGESVERLMGALLMEQDEAWSTGPVYFDMRGTWSGSKGSRCRRSVTWRLPPSRRVRRWLHTSRRRAFYRRERT